jgi:hypothetical protein
MIRSMQAHNKIFVQILKTFKIIKKTLLENPSYNLIQDLDNLRNSKKRTVEDKNSDIENSNQAKKACIDDEEKNSDIDMISTISSEDEKNSKFKAEKLLINSRVLQEHQKALKNTRLLCGFLYGTAKSQGKILVDVAQKYKGLIGTKEYAHLKEQCKETSESTSSVVRSYLSSYPDQRKIFKAKDGST